MPTMIDDSCTLLVIATQYYQQNRHRMSKCKHMKVLSSTLIAVGNGLITPLGLVIVPFEIDGIKI